MYTCQVKDASGTQNGPDKRQIEIAQDEGTTEGIDRKEMDSSVNEKRRYDRSERLEMLHLPAT
jgi:hypothetical protein